jgi:hypothetical protein
MKQKKDTKNKKPQSVAENPNWFLKELGVYSDDPVIDKQINNELLNFLRYLGLKKAEILFK